jgi:type VI secretion system protein ImpF
MADINKKTRLAPPLMQVFRAAHRAKDTKKSVDQRNEAGERVLAGRRLRARHVITESILRREVARDLDALLNAIALESSIDMAAAPYARKSILNFGLPDITHRSIDEAGVEDIPDEIRGALIAFEPRLAPGSIEVNRDTNVDPAELKLRYIIRADLTCDPVHVPVEFVADVIDNGKIIINRM